jgi:hypothetical protein
MIRFIRKRGRIIPIITDAVKKGSGYFGRPAKMALHENKMKALQAIRKTFGNRPTLKGTDIDAGWVVGDKVVKRMPSIDGTTDWEKARLKTQMNRFNAEVSLNHIGLAPDTFMVKANRTYLVQDKVHILKDSLKMKMTPKQKAKMKIRTFEDIRATKTANAMARIEEAESKAKKLLGFSDLRDLHWKNFGFKNKKVQIVDAGYAEFYPHNGYWTRDFAERTAKIRSRKFMIGKPEK